MVDTNHRGRPDCDGGVGVCNYKAVAQLLSRAVGCEKGAGGAVEPDGHAAPSCQGRVPKVFPHENDLRTHGHGSGNPAYREWLHRGLLKEHDAL